MTICSKKEVSNKYITLNEPDQVWYFNKHLIKNAEGKYDSCPLGKYCTGIFHCFGEIPMFENCSHCKQRQRYMDADPEQYRGETRACELHAMKSIDEPMPSSILPPS